MFRTRYFAPLVFALGCALLGAPADTVAGEAGADPVKVKPRPEGVRPALVKKPVRILRPAEQGEAAAPSTPEAPAEPGCSDCTDLVIGPCQVQCFKNTTYSTELCERVGYRSDLSFRAMPTAPLRNVGPRAVTFPAGARLWTIEGEDPASGHSPATGLYLVAGAEAPAPHRPAKFVHQPAPGSYVVRFVVDPDQLVVETDESNNVSECRWTVVPPGEPLIPDLAVVSVSISPASGNHNTVFRHTVTVTNVGNDDNSGFHVRCTPGSAWNQPNLAPGASVTQTYPIPDTATMAPGTHSVTCTASPFTAEPNTANNAATASFTLQSD